MNFKLNKDQIEKLEDYALKVNQVIADLFKKAGFLWKTHRFVGS